jgi:hypothetical protein
MYIVMCNSTQRVEGSYVHCIVQQYTDRRGFLCTVYVKQYTDSGGFLCTLYVKQFTDSGGFLFTL